MNSYISKEEIEKANEDFRRSIDEARQRHDLEKLMGTSAHAYQGQNPPVAVNRAQRRAMEAERRRMTRIFKRQLREATRGSIFEELPE